MPAQLTDLFNSVFMKMQLMLDVRGGGTETRGTLIPKSFFINNLEKDCWSFESIFGNLLKNLFCVSMVKLNIPLALCFEKNAKPTEK